MESKIKPVIVLPPDQMSVEDVERLNANGFCVVVAKNPDSIRFMDPPLMAYPAPERAALKLCRVVMASRKNNNSCADLTQMLCEFLMEGVPMEKMELQPVRKA